MAVLNVHIPDDLMRALRARSGSEGKGVRIATIEALEAWFGPWKNLKIEANGTGVPVAPERRKK